MKATIVTLEPIDGEDNLTVASFEEAFGEFSELRGRGRARRNKRRTERQQNRIGRRRARKKSRQDMRAEQQESRQSRKDTRKSRRSARKGSDDDSESEDSGSTNSDDSSSKDSGSGGQGEGEGEYQTTQDGDAEVGQEEEQSSEQGGEEEGGEEESEGFDGNSDSEDYVYGAEDYYMNVDGQKAKIHPKVKDIAKRIERNKERLTQLEMRLQSTQSLSERQSVSNEITKRRARLKELEGMLEGYSNARGRSKHGANRRKEIGQARKVARKERRLEKREKRKGGGERENEETEVESSLSPKFSKERIEIPASEEGTGFNGGTGFIGVDDKNDFDAPAVRKFDVNFSSADGTSSSKPKINLKALAIGVGVGLVAIYLIDKYKVFEKLK